MVVVKKGKRHRVVEWSGVDWSGVYIVKGLLMGRGEDEGGERGALMFEIRYKSASA